MNDDLVPDSPSCGGLPSSGSTYHPSQSSTCSSDTIGMSQSCVNRISCKLLSASDISNSQPDDVGGVSLDGCYLLVSWSCLIPLLSRCQREGCVDQVLPCNMDVSRNGKNNQLYSV